MATDRSIREDATSLRYRKIQEISDAGGIARSILHKKVRHRRASPNLASKAENNSPPPTVTSFTTRTETATAMLSKSNVKQQSLGSYLSITI